MKVGYVCQYFTLEYRGPVTNLMHELSREVDVVNYSYVGKHMQYHAGGRHRELAEKINDHLTLRRYDVRLKLGGLLFPKDLTALLGEDRPDIIQSEEYYQPASHQAFEFAKKNKIPFIVNHRGSEERTRTLQERLFFTAANPLSQRLVEGSDAIVCLSEAGKRVLCGIYPKAEGKIHVIPNSVDPARYAGADAASFRKEYGIPDSAPLLLCVARLHPQKRIDLLVRAFAQVKKQLPESVLCVVGPWFPKEKKKVDSIVSELKVEDVLFTGSIPNENVKNAYAAADAVALSSEYEPFGYCLLEAMSLSKPVVAFGIGAVPEIVDDKVTGYHVPFPDVKAFAKKAAALLRDRRLAAKMGQAGLKRVKDRFHIRDNAGRLMKLYGDLRG